MINSRLLYRFVEGNALLMLLVIMGVRGIVEEVWLVDCWDTGLLYNPRSSGILGRSKGVVFIIELQVLLLGLLF
jgi:hypothetical protein